MRTLPLLALLATALASSTTKPPLTDLCPIDVFRNINPLCPLEYICADCDRKGSPPRLLGDDDKPGNSTTSNGTSTGGEQEGQPEAPELLSFEQWKEKQLAVIGDRLPESFRHDNVGQSDPVPSNPASSDSTNSTSPQPITSNSPPSPNPPTTKPPPPPTNPKSSPPIHRYNYASPDCSARIHSSSPQTQHASSLLHKSKDRYMLTPCAAKEHWVIIELCDDIRIEAVEVGMFEFFSGVVREVRLSVGGEDEDDEDDDGEEGEGREQVKKPWDIVGSFIGKNVRGAQTFTLPSPTPFHRFLRIDFPSHYGSEYYCPVSSVKVWGMNQMEAFKWESRRGRGGGREERKREEEGRAGGEVVEKEGGGLGEVGGSKPPVAISSDTSVSSTAGTTSQPTQPATSTAVEAPSIGSESHSTAPSSSAPTPSMADPTKTSTQPVVVSTSTSQSQDTEPSASPTSTTSIPPTDNAGTATTSPVPSSDVGTDVAATKASESQPQPSEPTSTVQPTNSSIAPVATPSVSVSLSLNSSTAVLSKATSSVGNSTSTNIPAETQTSSQKPVPVTTSTSAASSAPTQSSAPPRASPPPARADSSESIYAFILRRITALEGNSTLAAMYIEEQSKITRELLYRMEGKYADWNAEFQERRREMDHFRSKTERQINETLMRLEQHSISMSKDRIAMKTQLRLLADQVASERRRGIAQLVFTFILAILMFIGSAKSLESALTPLLVHLKQEMRVSDVSKAKVRREPEEVEEKRVPKRRDTLPDEASSPLLLKSRSSSIRPSTRRPSTPTNSRLRLRIPPSLPRSADPSQSAHLPDSATFQSQLQNRSVTNASIPGRRLARSAHLHTIEADKVRQRLKVDAGERGASDFLTPTRHLGEGRPADTYSSQPGTAYLNLPSAFSPSPGPSPNPSPNPAEESSEYEDDTAASASEVEDARELASTPRMVVGTPKIDRRRWSSPWRSEVVKEEHVD